MTPALRLSASSHVFPEGSPKLARARTGTKSSLGCRRRERGSGTVLAVAAIGVLLVLATAGLQLGAAATAAHQSRTAADLAALAGATALQAGEGEACTRAAVVAQRNGAQIVECTLGVNESVSVRVSTKVATSWPGVPDHAVASARAGPADTRAREH